MGIFVMSTMYTAKYFWKVFFRQFLRKFMASHTQNGCPACGKSDFSIRYFSADPSIREIFGIEDRFRAQRLLQANEKFERHAVTFVKALNFIMRNLDDMEKIGEYARNLGARHVKFQVNTSRTFFCWMSDIFVTSDVHLLYLKLVYFSRKF